MTAIGLCMIVKNEAPILARCLDSVKNLVDHVLIVDTGSTDGTQQLVLDWLEENQITGCVVESSWKDFATNRTEALARMRSLSFIDYTLMIDADDQLEYAYGLPSPYWKENLTADQISILVHHDGIQYARPHLMRNNKPFYYRGVTHEFLDCAEPVTKGFNSAVRLRVGTDSHRRTQGNKFENDLQLLTQALRTETDPMMHSRYAFYLAQTYKDMGRLQEAWEAYAYRGTLGGWVEERYVSFYEFASLWLKLGLSKEHAIQHYLMAYEIVPHRAEALHGAAKLCRELRRYQQGYLLTHQGLTLPLPVNGLFVSPWIYTYGLLDEFSIAAYHVGHHQESLMACERLLTEGHIPDSERPRIEQNRQAALSALQGQA